MPEEIKDFHLTGGDGDRKNDLLMKREGTHTVSISQVVKDGPVVTFDYHDVVDHTESHHQINIP